MELRKLSGKDKRTLAEKLLKEAEVEEKGPVNQGGYQDTDFNNPFNSAPPATAEPHITPDGTEHHPALSPDSYTPLKMVSVRPLGKMTAEYNFSLPHPTDHTGCLAGQFVRVRVSENGPESPKCERFFSPVSATSDYGKITVLMKYETGGLLSQCFRSLQPGMLTIYGTLYRELSCDVIGARLEGKNNTFSLPWEMRSIFMQNCFTVSALQHGRRENPLYGIARQNKIPSN